MPELPDVEEFKRYMDSTALHKTIKKASVTDEQVLENTSAHKLEKGLKNNKFDFTKRHGKYLFSHLSGGKFLLMHFGMTGELKYFKNPDRKPEHTRLLIQFKNGYCLAYDNQRKFGKLNLINDVESYINNIELGPDVMDPNFDFEQFKKSTEGRRAMVKSFLMNQEIMAGIGNIYSDEILFQSGIHPEKRISSLNEKQLKKLFENMKDVMKRSIDRRADPSKLPDSFIIPHRNKGDKCPGCNGEVKRVKVSGRSSYYCPNCQKK